jgi:integrase/recombinase XerD
MGNLSPLTIAVYGRHLGAYERYLKRKRMHLAAMDEWDIGRFLRRRAEGKGPTVLRQALSAVRSFHKYLHEMRHVESDPTQFMEGPRVRRPIPEVLTPEEVFAMLATRTDKSVLSLRDLAVLEFGYATGARRAEWRGVRIQDLRDDFKVVRLYGKGQKERAVPVGRYAQVTIRRYLKLSRPHLVSGWTPPGALFLGNHGAALSWKMFDEILTAMAQEAGIQKRVTPHTLRHTFATHMLLGGAGIQVVQALLGHADISTTQIYTHLDTRHLQEVHARCHPLNWYEPSETT